MDPEAAKIDAYIAASSQAARPALQRIREIIHAATPDAEETISYRMPAFRWHGIIVYFAAFKGHVGLFPPIHGDARLDEALTPYRGPKGNLQFPLDQAMPYKLIERVVNLRAKQDKAKANARYRSRGSQS